MRQSADKILYMRQNKKKEKKVDMAALKNTST